MANYDELSLMVEGVRETLGIATRKVSDMKFRIKDWRNNRSIKEFKSKDIPLKDFEKLKVAFNGLSTAKNFREYRKHWNFICDYTHLAKEDSVMVKYELKAGKDNDRNYVYVKMAESGRTMTIPNGYSLYHISETPGITELKPQFRGKSAKGYFYSSPRVYLTIHKNMTNLAVDIKKTKKHTHTYQTVENFKTAKIDPLLSNYSFGAVYIDTMYPIRVNDINQTVGVKESGDDINESEFITEHEFESLEKFMEYYGLEFADDDEYYQESIKSKIGEVIRTMKDTKSFKEKWNSLAKAITEHITIGKEATDEKEYNELEACYDVMKSDAGFSKYKKAFNRICKFFGLKSEEVIIENLRFEKENNKIGIRYGEGRRKIVIPSDSQLIHITPVDNITSLEPSFKSKTVGKYMFPSKRVFFTVGKKVIDGSKCGLEKENKLFRYTPKENITVAYIDQSYTQYSIGAVYVDTPFPIPVEKI